MMRLRSVPTQTRSKPALFAALIIVATAVPLAAYVAGYSTGPKVAVVDPTVRSSDIEGYAPGSPERVLLAWWREMQLGNVESATAFYDPALGVSPKELTNQRGRLAAVEKRFDGTMPVIEDTQIDSNAATLHTFLKSQRQAPEGHEVIHYDPHTFTLRELGGDWVLADNAYIRQIEAPAGQ